jgi:hypothetical protein
MAVVLYFILVIIGILMCVAADPHPVISFIMGLALPRLFEDDR